LNDEKTQNQRWIYNDEDSLRFNDLCFMNWNCLFKSLHKYKPLIKGFRMVLIIKNVLVDFATIIVNKQNKIKYKEFCL